MTEEQQNQLQTPGLEEVKEKTTKLKGKESESYFLTWKKSFSLRFFQPEESSGPPDILSKIAMDNAYMICHNVQDLMYYRGFFWEGAPKGKGKKKKR